jgi:hypothetical protein
MDSENLVDLYNRRRDAADALHARAAQIVDLTKRLETLTKDTPTWYAGMRARVEDRAALEQAEELRRVLKKLLGEEPFEEDA